MTYIRERLPQSEHVAVFEWGLSVAVSKKLIRGKTVDVDSKTLEADVAMKSIVLRDSGDDWRDYVIGLMRAESVIGTADRPSEEELRQFDKNLQGKKVSSEDCKSPSVPDAEIPR